MKRFSFAVFRDKRTERIKHIYVSMWPLKYRLKVECSLSFELPFGIIYRDASGEYGTPIGFWTARLKTAKIFAFNFLCIGFDVLIFKKKD